MRTVIDVKRALDPDTMLRVVAPKMEANVRRRREAERAKRDANRRMARAGIRLKLL